MIAPKLRFKADDGSAFPDWEEKKINDIATCFAGATPSTKIPEYWEDGTIQWMSSGEVNNGQIFETEKRISKLGFDKCSTKMVKPNTVVIALAGQGKTRGMVAITRTSLCTNQSLCAIETNTDICDDYLYQYLQLQYNNLRLISSGDGTRGGLNLKLIGNYSVSIPSLSEQQKIADFLSTIDTIIEKQRATVSAWEERKKGVMQKLFSQEVRFKADDGSDFPDWEEKKLEEVSNKIKVGFVGTCDCFYVEKHGVKLYRTGNLIDGKLVDTDMKYVTRQFHEKNKKSQLKKWDILIARHGNSGHAVLYDSDEDANCLNIVIIQPNLDLVNPRFLTNNINSSVVEKQVYRLKGGSTQVVLNTTAIEKIKVSIPSLPEQQKIADFLSALDTVIQKQKETLEKWQELKKGLLQQMFV